MKNIDERLKELKEEMAMKKRLSSKIKELRAQKEELGYKISELEKIAEKELSDVEKLEGRSLYAFFYNVIGKKDEKLDSERKEAYEAKVKYDSAKKELEAVENYLSECISKAASINGCDVEYEMLMAKKVSEIKSSESEVSKELGLLENESRYVKNQIKEINEAISAGQVAEYFSERILDSLNSAENWGTWDLIGGGLVADLAKHSHLDTAQDMVEDLQIQLRKFKTELADIRIQTDAKVNLDSFTRFADYFFDGLFMDYTVLEKIRNSEESVMDTNRKIGDVLYKLKKMRDEYEKKQSEIETKINNLIMK